MTTPTSPSSQKTLDYIHANWERTFYEDKDGSGFKGDDLPFPYSSPCIKGEGKFFFFFYWDTYFTNIGLLAHGHTEMAKNNIKNMLWLIRRQGYMPNHVALFDRSQPPYLCQMVTDYLEANPEEADGEFYRECAEGLRQEYHFWITGRHTPTGLQRHGHHHTAEGCIKFYNFSRVLAQGNPADAPLEVQEKVGGHFLAEAETGWDFNQRFDARCDEHNAVDLNGLLYSYETWLLEASRRLDWGDSPLWEQRIQTRKDLVNQLLWNEESGWFFDYDFVNKRQSPVFALAGMLPLFSGLASPEQAERAVANLHLFERDSGIAVTDDRPGCRNYQWAFPNAWPPLTCVTLHALARYGFHEDARRIARKFVDNTDRLFQETGQLWEKTDAETGSVAGSEYDAAPMMGWSAGVYVACKEYLHQNES